MKTFVLTVGLIVVASLAPAVASAQNRSNTGGNTGSSAFGSTGTSGFGNTGSSGSSGFGSTGTSGFGSSGFGGQSGAGGGGQTGFGAGGQTGFGGQNQLGANGNNGGILGRNTNPNQLLGRNVQNAGVGQNNNFGGGRGGGGNRGNNGLNALNSAGGNAGNTNQQPIVRPRLEVGFNFPKPKTDNIQVAIESRLTKLSVKSPALKSVMVSVEDKGEVVLRGTVASESEAKLATQLLRLEPGVQSIRNELTFPDAEVPAE